MEIIDKRKKENVSIYQTTHNWCAVVLVTSSAVKCASRVINVFLQVDLKDWLLCRQMHISTVLLSVYSWSFYHLWPGVHNCSQMFPIDWLIAGGIRLTVILCWSTKWQWLFNSNRIFDVLSHSNKYVNQIKGQLALMMKSDSWLICGKGKTHLEPSCPWGHWLAVGFLNWPKSGKVDWKRWWGMFVRASFDCISYTWICQEVEAILTMKAEQNNKLLLL